MLSNEHILQTHAEYHQWATAEMWKAVRLTSADHFTQPLPTSFGSLGASLSHMYRVDRLWLARLNSEPALLLTEIAVPDAAELESTWGGLLSEFVRAVAGSSANEIRSFVNSQGARFHMPVWQLVLHVVNHGTGHRGQINGILRQFGIIPRGTDLVQYFRLVDAAPSA